MLFWYELKKILCTTVIWVFMVICLIFNIWLMPANLNESLDTTTSFHENVFEGFSTIEIAEAYISTLGLTGGVAESMRTKYKDLQIIVDRKAIAGVSFSPYLGENSYIMHQNLFHGVAGVMGRILIQGILISVLLALLAVGYEQINNTEHSVYTTKKGRNILFYKITASLTAGIGVYVLLTIITLIIYFSMHNYGGVWGSSVSSGFNFIQDPFIGVRPFTTWQSFNLAKYLLASFGISLGLIVCFLLMGIIVGTFARNVYIGFLLLVLINGICLVSPLVFSIDSYARYIVYQMPIWLWWNSNLWFTDGSFITIWKNFELWGTGVSLLLLTIICLLAVKLFEKRDIA